MKQSFNLIFLTFFAMGAFAQQPQQPKVVIYKPFSTTETVEPNVSHRETMCVKWNSFLLVRGVFSLSAEKMLTSQLSVEADGGVTYRDWVFEFNKHLDLAGFMSENELDNSFGTMFGIKMKYYVSEGDLEGIYVSPFIRHRKYNISTVPSNPNTPGKKIGYQMFEYGILFGVQQLEILGDISTEVYIGCGLSNQDYYKAEDSYGTDIFLHRTKSVPLILFGVNFGLSF